MDSVKELLGDQTRGQRKAQGILCYLFRNVLHWSGMNLIKWNKCANLYFEKPHNKNKPVDKGNLNKMLIPDDMTWGSFIRGIDFLNPVAATLTIILTWKDGRVSEYVIALDPAEDESDPQINRFDEGNEDSEIFNNQQKPTNTLARLYRQIIRTERIDGKPITQEVWNRLFEEFVKNPLNGLLDSKSDISNHINTLQRAAVSDRLSWNTFRRSLLVLQPVREEYLLTMRWSNDPVFIKRNPDNAVTYHRAGFSDPYLKGKVHARLDTPNSRA